MNFDDLSSRLLEDGLVVFPNESISNRNIINSTLQKSLECVDLSSLHHQIDFDSLNSERLKAYQAINSLEDWEQLYFSMAKNTLEQLLGPDLLIQRKLNLSIQMPNDTSSKLGLHMDTLSGQSPFELVMWAPFSNFSGNAGMYYFTREISRQIMDEMDSTEEQGLEYLRQKYWRKHQFIEIQPDQVALFCGSIFHGNIKNTTQNTRVSINCRFKNLYSPEISPELNERGVGIFYKLLQTSVVTRIGMNYSEERISF